MRSFTRVGLLCLALGLGGTVGCQSARHGDGLRSRVGMELEPSTTNLVAGETVTVMAHTQDTIGRDVELQWANSAGELTTEKGGRVARVRFDQPGTYQVTARMLVDGREIERDTIEIKVRPVT